MFCILGLDARQVRVLRGMFRTAVARCGTHLTRSSLEMYHIYMAESSRISIAGLNESNVAYVANAIDAVVRDED